MGCIMIHPYWNFPRITVKIPTMTTMADLMASLDKKHISFSRGEEIKGEIVQISESEVIVDLGGKSEGALNKRDFLPEQLEELKIGSEIKAFVLTPENESGQVILSLFRAVQGGKRAEEQAKKWQKFITAQQRQTTLLGRVIEVNKGVLVVEIDSSTHSTRSANSGRASSGQASSGRAGSGQGKIRGFVPSSQVSLKSVAGFTGELAGQELKLKVIEIDPGDNRLVLTARAELSDDEQKSFSGVKSGDKVSGEVVAVAPFGLFVNVDGPPASLGEQGEALRAGLEGVIFATELSWTPFDSFDKTQDGSAQGKDEEKPEFKVGDKVEAKVIGKDENLGRLNLSLRQMQEDPFTALAENFQVDDVVSGTVKEITTAGISVALEKGVEGLVPAAKVDQGNPYTVGQTTNFLVDSVDTRQRKINLAPFLTSTVGLIYK